MVRFLMKQTLYDIFLTKILKLITFPTCVFEHSEIKYLNMYVNTKYVLSNELVKNDLFWVAESTDNLRKKCLKIEEVCMTY